MGAGTSMADAGGMVASTISLTPVPAPLSTLSIAGRAGHAFTPHAMMEGFACHARGVELPAAGPARVHARVRSKRVHDVHLHAEKGRLLVSCTCPARSFGLDVCKHVWAALLEVDRHDALGDLRTARGLLVVEASPLPPAGPPDVEEAKRSREAAGSRPAAKPAKDGSARPSRSTDAPTKDAPAPKALAKTSGPPKPSERSDKPASSKESRTATEKRAQTKDATGKPSPSKPGRARTPSKSAGTSKRRR